jgi:beta-mannosidase
MGTVWWQLNDCWPVTSWSVIDWSGQPKPAWYALQAAYRPRLLTIQPRGASLFVFAVNDTRENWSVNGVARRLAFDGTVLAAQPISLWVNGSAIANTEITETVSSAADPSRELLVFETDDDRCLWWFLPDKDLAYERPRLRVEQMAVEETSLSIAIRTDSLVRDLAIMPDRVVPGARCDRQLITLLPGEQPTVTVTGLPPGQAMAVEELTATPVLWSAYSAVHGPD